MESTNYNYIHLEFRRGICILNFRYDIVDRPANICLDKTDNPGSVSVKAFNTQVIVQKNPTICY